MNTQLLVRTTRGVTPTSAGTTALRYASAMQAAADAFSLEVANHNDPVEGPITVATGDGVGPYWLAPRLPRFHLANPKIELNLKVLEHIPNVVGGEADITIQFSEPAKHDVIARRLGVLHYMLFASQDYLDTFGHPNSIYEFNNHRMLIHSGYVQQPEHWMPKIPELRRIIDFALVTNSATALVNACAGGGGIAILPSYFAMVDPRLVALDLPEIAPTVFWLCYTERVRRLSRGQMVIDWIRAAFDPACFPWFRDSFVHPNSLEDGGVSGGLQTGSLPPALRKVARARGPN